jgi:hypothetical protein
MLSLWKNLPLDVVYHILTYESNYLVRNGQLILIRKMNDKKDPRYRNISDMFREREMIMNDHIFNYDYDVESTTLVLPIGRDKEYIVYVYEVEVYDRETRETYTEYVRELRLHHIHRNQFRNQLLLYEY